MQPRMRSPKDAAQPCPTKQRLAATQREVAGGHKASLRASPACVLQASPSAPSGRMDRACQVLSTLMFTVVLAPGAACVSQRWPPAQVRHGAAVALREILRSHAACAAVTAPLAAQPSGAPFGPMWAAS